MERIKLEISDYRVEGISFKFTDDGDPVFDFTVGLYSPSGRKITTVQFSNRDTGYPFKPNREMNEALREALIACDDWFGGEFIPFIMNDNQSPVEKDR